MLGKLLSKFSSLRAALLMFVLIGGVLLVEDKVNAETAISIPISVEEHYEQVVPLLNYINEERRALGREELILDSGYVEKAMIRASDITLIFGHGRPDGSGVFTSGENIAYGYVSAKSVFNGWKSSGGHYAAMIEDSFKYCGIGCVKHAEEVYWVFVADDIPSGSSTTSIPNTIVNKQRSIPVMSRLLPRLTIRRRVSGVTYGAGTDRMNYFYLPTVDMYNGEVCPSGAILPASMLNFSNYDTSLISIDPATGFITPKKRGRTTVTVNLTGTTVTSQVEIVVMAPSAGGDMQFALDTRTFVYDGTEKKPKVTLARDQYGNEMVEGVDFRVEYEDNVNIGTGWVYIYGIGNYLQDINPDRNMRAISFSIEAPPTKTIESLNPVFKDTGKTISTFKYTGAPVKPKVLLKDGDKVLQEGVDYTLTYYNNVEENSWDIARVCIEGKGMYYTGCYNLYFSIEKAQTDNNPAVRPPTVSKKDVAKASIKFPNGSTSYSVYYTGKSTKPKLTVIYGTTTLREGVDYTVSGGPYINPGKVKIIVDGIGNYTGSKTLYYNIVKKRSMTSATVRFPNGSSSYTATYTGKSTKPKLVIKYGTSLLREGTDFTISGGPYVNPGKVKIVIRGINSYTGTKTVYYSIVKKMAAVTLSKTKLTYNGRSQKPKLKVTYGGKTVSSRYYSVSWKNNKYPGTATVTVTGKGSYKGKISVKKSFLILPKKVSIKTPSSGKGYITAKWSKHSGVSGYQVQISKSKKFASDTATYYAKGTSLKIKRHLERKKRYYVRVRAYKVIGGKPYYGAWSSVKYKTVK